MHVMCATLSVVAGSLHPMPTPSELIALATTPGHPGRQETAARERWGLTPTAYWVRLHRAIHDADTIAAHPVECRMLRERMDRRRWERLPRRAA